MRRLGIVALTAGVLLCLPVAAFAEESAPQAETGVGAPESVERDPAAQEAQQPEETTTPDETGIGEADAVECRGTVTATVVDLDGAPVAGSVLTVAGQQVADAGTVEATCGEVAATLLAAPEGYAAAGPTTQAVQVRNAAAASVTFTVDVVQVLGVQIEKPADTPAAPQPEATAEAAPELAATGPADAPVLLLVALLCGLLGTVLLGATPSRAEVRTGS